MQIRHFLVLLFLKLAIIAGYVLMIWGIAWAANQKWGLPYSIGVPLIGAAAALLFFFDERDESVRKIMYFPLSRYLRKRLR